MILPSGLQQRFIIIERGGCPILSSVYHLALSTVALSSVGAMPHFRYQVAVEAFNDGGLNAMARGYRGSCTNMAVTRSVYVAAAFLEGALSLYQKQLFRTHFKGWPFLFQLGTRTLKKIDPVSATPLPEQCGCLTPLVKIRAARRGGCCEKHSKINTHIYIIDYPKVKIILH